MQGRLIYGFGGILIGLVAGFFAANSLNRDAVTAPSSISAADTGNSPSSNPNNTGSQLGGMQGDVTQTLEKAEKEPNNFVAQMLAGDMYAQIGKFDKAVEFYKRGIALDGENLQANVVLANALFDSQRFEEAEVYYAKALQIDPRNVNALTDLGTTFVERKEPDYDRAILEYKKALQIDPKSSTTIYYLGIAHLRKGERQEAERTLTELEQLGAASELVTRLRQNISQGSTIQ